MVMSHNWTTSDLASRLRQIDVRAGEVRVGDIVVPGNCGPWQVARANRRPGRPGRSFVLLLDEDGNGGEFPADFLIRIVARSALAVRIIARSANRKSPDTI